MSVYDNSKLYWLKLYDDFYRQDSIEWLLNQEYGTTFIVLYQMLLLKTINRDGKLYKMLGNKEMKYEISDIVKLTGINEKLVQLGIDNLMEVGLLERNLNGIVYLPNLSYMIGSSTKGAAKKSIQRNKADKCPPDIDKDTKEDERYI
jgi:hypothetical protein